MVRVGRRICEQNGCGVTAIFNYRGEKLGRFCATHALENMFDIKNKRCEYEGCPHQPSYNYDTEKRAIFCSEHRLEGMVDIKSKRCEHFPCRKGPVFNYPDENQGRFCKKHALENMVDVKNQKCEKCNQQPSFNYLGQSKARFCKLHMLEGMVDVKHKKCERLGCNIRPVFNYKGQTRGIFCVEHAAEDMIDVESKLCERGCGIRASFNYDGETEGKFCKQHALKDMINVKQVCCEYPGCPKQPSFNHKGEKGGAFCRGHASEDMVDVINPKCTIESCGKIATYSLLFSPLIRCATHKTRNMVPSHKRNPVCDECHVKPAYYAPPSTTYPTHCEDHAPSNYINIIEKPCESCKLSYFIPEDQKLCQNCRDFDNPVIVHSKELRIKAILEANNIPLVSHDKVPPYACSKKRPDFVIDCDYFFLIVEIDEDQHKSYACDCEVSRMIQLHQEFGGAPVVFIRYNPDNYTDYLGNFQKGRKQNPKREKRLINLIQNIRKRHEVPGEPSIYYLYYDGDDETNTALIMDYFDFSVKEIADEIEASITVENTSTEQDD